MRAADVFFRERLAGVLREDEHGYSFAYEPGYLQLADARPVSLTLPLRSEAYASKTLFAFFDGLIPEGWLLNFAVVNWKLNPSDRMGLLLCCCKDCIGAVSVVERTKKGTTDEHR